MQLPTTRGNLKALKFKIMEHAGKILAFPFIVGLRSTRECFRPSTRLLIIFFLKTEGVLYARYQVAFSTSVPSHFASFYGISLKSSLQPYPPLNVSHVSHLTDRRIRSTKA